MRSEADVQKFIENRDHVLTLLVDKTEDVQLSGKVKQFTFGDTILLAMRCNESSLMSQHCRQFILVLRKFLVDSLNRGLFLRGSLSIGFHYSDEKSNTVLGPAVDDAAGWYEQADWIGLHVTPLASMKIEEWREAEKGPKDHLVIDYDVPIKGESQRLKAVNWPKVLFVKELAPSDARVRPRRYLLERLTVRDIPRGVESKYSNTMKFFDHVVKMQKLKPLPAIVQRLAPRKSTRSGIDETWYQPRDIG